MKILEVRDGYIKFEADRTVVLTSFVQISDFDKNYIAQVVKLNNSAFEKIAYAKILFLYNGELLSYDKSLPSIDSEIKEFTDNILQNSIVCNTPLIVGKTFGDGVNLNIDASAFNKKMLVSIDDKDANNLLVRNLTKQFRSIEKKVLIIDTLGVINAKKYIAGVDFKLPLNIESLAFMYKDCLNEATADSKSMIVEIFKDLSEYSQSVPFVPFATLKTIVDDMVDNSHIFKLFVLKNKLAKFDKLGFFANNVSDVDSLKNIVESKFAVIDISKLDTVFQNQYLAHIYKYLENDVENRQVVLELSNTVSKKNLKNIIDISNVATTFVTHSKFQYLNDIKNLFDNFIIMPSIANNKVFDIYSTFLNAMQRDSYLIVGESTNYIPVISRMMQIDDVNEPVQQNEIAEQNDVISELEDKNVSEEINVKTEECQLKQEVDATQNQETDVVDEIEEADSQEIVSVNEDIIEETADNIEEVELSSEEIISNIDEKSSSVIEEIIQNAEDLSDEPVNIFDDEDGKLEAEADLESEVVNEQNIENNEIISDADLQEVLLQEDEQNIQQEVVQEVIETTHEELIDTEAVAELVEINEDGNTQDVILEELTEISLDEPAEEETYTELLVEEENAPISLEEELIQENITLEQETIEQIETEELIEDESSIVEIPESLDIEIEEVDESLDIIEESSSIENSFEEFSDKTEVLPIAKEEDFGEIVELDALDVDDADIVIEMEEEPQIDLDSVDEQIVKDVDKVFTSRKDEEISDSDLDFIDELNGEDNVMLEEIAEQPLEEFEEDSIEILEEIGSDEPVLEENDSEILEKRNSSTPMVPVYEAEIPVEDLVVSDPIQQGDLVMHAKYGAGVVEKMIKYGAKSLYSINFENIGRRLLDPTLTEIKKR